MAFVALSGGQSGDLDLYGIYNFGYFADTVLIRDGGAFSYLVATYEGNDVIDNSRSTTTLQAHSYFAGSGNDRIIGGASNEFVFDGSGNDTVALGAGSDSANACSGNDVMDGGSGIDILSFNFSSFDGAGVGILFVNFSSVTADLAKEPLSNACV